MFKLSNRRYTGAKTKLLSHIEKVMISYCDTLKKEKEITFFDIFGGTGVVSEYFLLKNTPFDFKTFYINDFLYSNYIIYQGFLSQEEFNQDKINIISESYQKCNLNDIQPNYYTKHFGGKFFSFNDAKKIDFIRDDIDNLLRTKTISPKEFYILLASLLYSVDKIANTVGHYDAYRKNFIPKDCFLFNLIEPIISNKEIKIFQEDANSLVEKLHTPVDVVFIDPPYNSRQYSRFYHLLETLSRNDKPKLYGVAKKPTPENISKYCKIEAKEVFKDLIEKLSKISKCLVITYNNTTNANSRSNTRIAYEDIVDILQSKGETKVFTFDHKPFNSGKTDFKNHQEILFLCKI